MEIRFAIRLVPISLYKDASSNDPYGTVVKNFPLPGMLQLEPNWYEENRSERIEIRRIYEEFTKNLRRTIPVRVGRLHRTCTGMTRTAPLLIISSS
jgi:hypothetical protein